MLLIQVFVERFEELFTMFPDYKNAVHIPDTGFWNLLLD